MIQFGVLTLLLALTFLVLSLVEPARRVVEQLVVLVEHIGDHRNAQAALALHHANLIDRGEGE